jgi:hypothetical protein
MAYIKYTVKIVCVLQSNLLAWFEKGDEIDNTS